MTAAIWRLKTYGVDQESKLLYCGL